MNHKLLLFILSFLTLGLTAQNVVTTTGPRLYQRPATPQLDAGGGSTGFPNFADLTETNLCGLNFVYGSVMTETRSIASGYNTNGTGFPATINISGLPTSCMVVLHAFLYYDASYTEGSAPTTTATITTPSAIVATYTPTMIGTGPAKCWGEHGTATYRADIAASISTTSGNGNYKISLGGLTNASSEVDGCSLIIVYQAGPTAGGTGTFFFFDGSLVQNTSAQDYDGSHGPGTGDSVYGIPVCNNTTSAESFFLIADQTSIPGSNTTNLETGDGVSASFPNNQWNFNIIPGASFPTSGGANTTFFPYRNDFAPFGSPPTFDCYNLIMFGMYFQNSGCTNCEPVITHSGTTYPSCNGDNTGSITTSVSAGTSPYTYTWSSGATTASVTGLSAGTYTLSVEDVICNTAQLIVTITQPIALIGSKDSTGISCYGANTGTATVNSSGGTSPYTYSWSNGQTKSTATGLSAGTYTITMQDKHGCSETASITITQSTAIVISILNSKPTCNGSTNGSATIGASGGITPYTYSWSPTGGTNVTISNLSAGTYTITVNDNNSCSKTAAVTITQSSAVGVNISTSTNGMCGGGSATVSGNGGTSPYTYSWSPGGATTATISNLASGTYVATVTDINGCSNTGSVTLTGLSNPTLGMSSTNVSCSGGNDGSATVSVSGGGTPYTYSWSPGGGVNATKSNLTAGTYTVTVTNTNSCSATTTVTITQPAAPISPTISANGGVTCYGGTTTATISTSGGTSPYTYSWAPIGGTNATGTGLTVGTYTVTIKDINGCTPTAASTTVVVTQPAAPVSPTISANPGVMCYGGTSSVTVTTSGGTSPYTYSWAPIGGTNATGTGLTVGTYTVTIHDINGCTPTAASTTVVVTQPAAPVSPIISANGGVLCYGGTTTATITTSGGTSPYTYSWSPIGGTNATGTGLTVGTYTITIKDINGCTPTAASTIVVVTQPAAPVSPTISGNPGVGCYGGTSSVTVTTSGGTSPYTYSWAPIGGTNATGTGLTVGTYTVTIHDINGCTPTAASTTVVVTQPAAPVSPTISANPGISCYGGTTTATITTSGGTSPYTYSWSPIGGTNATGTGLTVGTYTVTIKDINGCTATNGATTVIITQPAAPVSPTISANPGVSCYGGTTTATITTSGGTSPYTYSWAPIGGTNAIGTGLTVGTYTVTIKDINGCTATSGATIVVVTQPAAPVSPTISANGGVLCYGGTTTATITTSGGTSPYTYSWAPIGGTNATGTGLTVGTYTVTIKDINGCTATGGATIVVVTQPAAPVSPTISANGGVLCYGGTTTATITTSGGTSPYTYSWSPIGGTNATGTGLTVGTYTVTIKDINGCTATGGATTTVIITQPAAYGTTISSMHASCGLPTGSATVSVTGSTSPYTYSWSPSGQTASTATGLSAGIYTVTVTDINSCLTTASITVTQTSSVASTLSATTQVSCYGNNDGAGTLTTTGGTAPYTYTWSPIGGTNATGTGLTAGTYTVNVVDAQGCIGTSATIVVITQPGAPVSPTISANPGVTCYGGTTTATISTSGGTSPYTYSWAPIGGTNATGTGLTVGTYTITIKDINGCTPTAASTTVVVTQPAAPVSPTISANGGVLCYGGTTTATITTSGGTSPYTYSWSPIGGTNTTGTGLTVGTYTVTIKDINGCTATGGATTVVVTQPAAPVSPTISTNGGVLCYGGTTTATITTSGGTSPYTYSWSPIGGTNATGTGLTVGTYTITIKDINGCTPTAASTTVVVTQPAAPVSPTISANGGIGCYGGTTTATITTSGGTSPYTYSWSPIGGTNATGTGLTVGTYTVTIKDINGCTATGGATTVVVTQPAAPVSPTISANGGVLCYGGTTTATITTSGGTSPYTYSWSPIGGTNATGTGLTVGTYTVTIKDINGCTATSGATIVVVTQPTAPVSPTISANGGVLCYGGTTTATITTSGGTSPYTYSWAPIGGTNATGTGLTVGTYTITIKDINGCTPTNGATTIIVTQPAAPVSPTISANGGVLCYGGTTTATITTSGGTSPYTYSWSPIGGTNATGTGLTVGTYTVTIKDANGCSSTGTSTTVVVTQPAPIKSTVMTSLGIACNGGTKDITISTSGGTSPYTYLWSPIGGTNATGTGLTAGTYTVYITDNNGCSGTATSTVVTLTQPSMLSATARVSNSISCNGGNGTAIVTPSGGTSPYTYFWAPIGGTNATGTGLTAGTYTITVTDNNHCSPTSSIVTLIITQPTSYKVTITANKNDTVICPGDTTTINAIVSGGGGMVTYKWSTGATTSSITISDSLTTTYSAVVFTPCDTFTISQKITVYPIPTMTVCCNTKILIGEDTTLVAIGGVGDIKTYKWTEPNGDISLNHDTGRIVIATPTVTTTYTVTGTDTSGCEVVRFVTIVIEIPCNFTVPNVFTPTYAGTLGLDNKLYINYAPNMDSWSITIFDRWGVQLFSSSDPFTYWDGNTSGGSKVPAGVYYYMINASCQGHNIQKNGYVQLIR